MSKTTINALLARGMDSSLAKKLSNSLTLADLKQKKLDELISLGIPELVSTNILNGSRPPIPKLIVKRLLYKSKMTCCVCRDRTKSVVLHHIIEWSISRDHCEYNLVVLCLEHHNDAHTSKGLSQNLSAEQLTFFKTEWEKFCLYKDNETIFQLGDAFEHSSWAWINIPRLLELLFSSKNIQSINVTSNIVYFELVRNNVF